MYEERAKLRKEAISEFKDKYGNDYFGFDNKEWEGDKLHETFEEIYNSVRDRMGLGHDGKPASIHKSDIVNMITVNKKYNNHGSNLNVVYASEHHGIENTLKFKWDFAGYGLLTSIVVYVLMNLFKKNNRDLKLLNSSQNSYNYQSI